MSFPGKRSSGLAWLLIAPFVFGASLLTSPVRADCDDDDEGLSVTFNGSFDLSFGHLSFDGNVAPPRQGLRALHGDTDFGPGSSPACFAIVNDAVTITAADGSELYLVNSGEDCLDFSTGAPVISGTGRSEIVGGTGHFEGATGVGTYSVAAPVSQFTEAGADGTFTLSFNLLLDGDEDHHGHNHDGAHDQGHNR